MVLYDWIIRVYRWMGIPENVCRVIKELMRKNGKPDWKHGSMEKRG